MTENDTDYIEDEKIDFTVLILSAQLKELKGE